MGSVNFPGSTPAPKSKNVSRSEQSPDFDGISLQSAGVRSNAAAAADTVSTSGIYSGLRENAPNYGEIATTAMANRASERISAATAEANIASAGLEAEGAIKAAEYMAEAQKAAGKSAAKGGMFSALGGIASAAVGLLSDETTKENIVEIEDGLETLRQLRPVSFEYKSEFTLYPERTHNGFIAQEYREVLPDATYEDKHLRKLTIDQQDLIAVQVRAIQQLEERVKELESKLVK